MEETRRREHWMHTLRRSVRALLDNRGARLLTTLLTVLLTIMAALAIIIAMAVSPAAYAAGDTADSLRKVPIGTLSFSETAPEGMVSVLGKDPTADAFLASLDEKFKLVVIGAYAKEKDFEDFTRAMKSGEFMPIPNIALVTIPRKMPEKSFDGKAALKEIKRYVSWFTLATNTGAIALGFEVSANSSLTKKLGRNFEFAYRTGKHTKIFNQTPTSLSAGVLTSLTINGKRSDNYVALSAFQVGDKFVFISMVGLDRSQEGVDRVRAEILAWKNKLAALNAPPLAVREAEADKEAPQEGADKESA
jgi:hypothetical protein